MCPPAVHHRRPAYPRQHVVRRQASACAHSNAHITNQCNGIYKHIYTHHARTTIRMPMPTSMHKSTHMPIHAFPQVCTHVDAYKTHVATRVRMHLYSQCGDPWCTVYLDTRSLCTCLPYCATTSWRSASHASGWSRFGRNFT